MCWGPEHEERALSDAQEEIRRLFDRYRPHPAEAPEPVESTEDEEAEPAWRDGPLVVH